MPTTFYSDTVESALAAARRSLGEETVLVEAGDTPAEERERGAYRVVASGGGEQPAPRAAAAPAEAACASPGLDGLRSELRAMRAALDAVGSLAARSVLDRSALARSPELAPWVRRLLEMDVPAATVQLIVEGAVRRLSVQQSSGAPAPKLLIRRAVAAEVDARLTVRPGFGLEEARCRVVALVGPAGAGKTTTLAKLAMRHAVSGRQSAMLLSVDVFRIAAAEQLRCLAAILGIPFRLCETPGALRRALDDARERDMVFIDTPGAGAHELEWWQGWVPRLVAEPDIETQLVLPATASPRQLVTWVQRYSALQPSRLIFTHLDEAATSGGLLAAAQEARCPISFLATGQGIPEDIEPAAKPRLMELLLGDSGALGAAA